MQKLFEELAKIARYSYRDPLYKTTINNLGGRAVVGVVELGPRVMLKLETETKY